MIIYKLHPAKKVRISYVRFHPTWMPFESLLFRVLLFDERKPSNPMLIHMPDHYMPTLSFN